MAPTHHDSPAVGDIVEIPTDVGLAYAQFSHEHEEYGELLRVLPGIFHSRPEHLAEVVEESERFFTFYPLRDAVREGDVTIVAKAEVPSRSRSFPTMKSGIRSPETDHIEVWWLWDGSEAWRQRELSSAQRDLSVKSIVSHDVLLERITSGWSPRDWPAPATSQTVGELGNANAEIASRPSSLSMNFFLYFQDDKAVCGAVTSIEEGGFRVEVQRRDHRFLVVAQADVDPGELDEVEGEFERLATSLSGEYDGNEVRLS